MLHQCSGAPPLFRVLQFRVLVLLLLQYALNQPARRKLANYLSYDSSIFQVLSFPSNLYCPRALQNTIIELEISIIITFLSSTYQFLFATVTSYDIRQYYHSTQVYCYFLLIETSAGRQRQAQPNRQTRVKETIDFKIKVFFWLNIKIFIYSPKKKFTFLAQNVIYLEKNLFS